jgi:hypothetical protein
MNSEDSNPDAETLVAMISHEASPEDPSSSRRPRLARRCTIEAPKEEHITVKRKATGKRRSEIDAEPDDRRVKVKKKKHSARETKRSATNPGEDLDASAGDPSLNPPEEVAASTGEKKSSTNPVEDVASSSGSRTRDSVSSNGEGKKLMVYSVHYRDQRDCEGNVEFRKDCEAAKFVYLDPDATMESKLAVVEEILQRYNFYAMDEAAARTKIVKAVSEKRGFYDKLTTAEDREKFALLERFKRQGSHALESRTRPPRPIHAPPPVPTESEHLHEFLKGDYIEELAFHHYREPYVKDEDLDQLGPLPPPPSEIPRPPHHCSITWTYDPKTRVYLGDFSSVAIIPKDQKWFLGSLMERDDITVICEGLYKKFTDVKKFLYLLGCKFGHHRYGKFRRFIRRQSPDTGFIDYQEIDGYVTMNVKKDYLNYVARKAYGGSDFDSCAFDLQTPVENEPVVGSEAAITTESAVEGNAAVKTDTTDPLDDVSLEQSIYMTDVEMAGRYPRFDKEYKQNFKMKEILPGGKWCLMSHVCEYFCLALFSFALPVHLSNQSLLAFAF